MKKRDSTNRQAEADSTVIALFTAAAADNPPLRQAVVTEVRYQIPRGRFFGFGSDRALATGVSAGAAKRAFAPRKVDSGKTPASFCQDAGFAGADAVSATIAKRNERSLIDGPGRTNGPLFATEITTQKLRAANDLVHHFLTPSQRGWRISRVIDMVFTL